MKKGFLMLVALAGLGGGATCAEETSKPPFAMANYVLVLLHKGPVWSAKETPENEALHKAHIANITRLFDEGKIILAGPFLDNGELRGLFLLRVETVAEARKLVDTDPAVKARHLRAEYHPWMGAAGIRSDATPAVEKK